MTEVNAKVIADSITPDGQRLTSVQVTFHRFVLAEMNTHCVFARNSASSRAIPVGKQLARFTDDSALPLVWPCEQPGMSGGAELEGVDLDSARWLFEDWNRMTRNLIDDYLAACKNEYGDGDEAKAHTLHKSLINRLMEPMQWHTALVTSTAWENFFFQRCHPAAQPEMRVAAEAIRDAMKNSTPESLRPGEYHLPYIRPEDWAWACDEMGARYTEVADTDTRAALSSFLRPISTARCARTSYMTQDGKRDPAEDLKLYHRLLHTDEPDDPMHASPLEHVATPAPWNRQLVGLAIVDGQLRLVPGGQAEVVLDLPIVGKFVGWAQHRHEVEVEQRIQSFR